MNNYYSIDKKKFMSLEEKTKHDMDIKDNYEIYAALVITDNGPGSKEPGGVMSCPGTFFIKRTYEKGIRDMRVRLRTMYGDEFIDPNMGIKRWKYVLIHPFSNAEEREFITRYGIISVFEGPIDNANKESSI